MTFTPRGWTPGLIETRYVDSAATSPLSYSEARQPAKLRAIPNALRCAGNFGGALEDISIGDCRLVRLLAENEPQAVLGLLQHNRGLN